VTAIKPNDLHDIPQTVATGLAACDESACPLIHTLLTILLTLPVSTASAEKFFYFKETQDLDEVKDGKREIDVRSSNVERPS